MLLVRLYRQDLTAAILAPLMLQTDGVNDATLT
jgi:hypothetical protein